MRILILAAVVLGCIRVYAAEPAAINPSADLLSQVLEKCSLENRRAFLGGVRFIGNGVADIWYAPITECLGTLKLKRLGEQIAAAGRGETASVQKSDENPKPLFDGCPAAARAQFYDSLQFRDGRLVGLFVAKIEECGKQDLPRFLSLFGTHGPDPLAGWRKDCRSDDGRRCARKTGYFCSPEICTGSHG